MPNAPTFTNTSLQTTINSYAYQQYADDDNIVAFFNAYNLATQYYVSWFASTSLPYYPGLTGPLLDWAAQGIWGLTRTAVEAPIQPAIGPLNTVVLNDTTPANNPAGQLNYYAFPIITVYQLTDDFYQRILTWDIYKADGKRFSLPWLKRRVMRFLSWPNGVDPPSVGPEDTSAISATFSGTTPPTITVNINQARLSALVPNLAPGIVSVFQAAFTGGALDLPVQFGYACNVVTNLTAMATPTSLSSVANASSQTTAATTVTLSGGSGSYTYVWTWQSGGTSITTTSPTAASTTFSTTGLASGSEVSGVALCTVTDTITSHTATVAVPVVIENAAPISITITPSSLTAQGSTATLTADVTNVVVTGGIAPYTYAWTWQSGGTGIQIDTPLTRLTNFTATGLAPGGSDSGTALLTVTDSASGTGTQTLAVTLSRANTPAVITTPSSLSVAGASSSESAGSSTASVTGGGVAPFTYSWAWSAGGVGITISGASTTTATFSATSIAPGSTLSGTATCTVTDSLGGQGSATVAVSIVRVPLLSASVSPGSQSSSSIKTTQTTGSSIVSATGGQTPYAYAWSWSSGGFGISIGSPSAGTTNFTGSGLTNGDSYSGTAKCTVTDAYGQTASVTVTVSILCNQATYIYTNEAAQVFTIPNGVTTLKIGGWANGGTGQAGSGSTCGGPSGGGGSASGYVESSFSVTSASWGKTFNISQTNFFGAAVKITSGTYSLTTMTANPGATGTSGTTPGGTASGGNVHNTTGASGAPPGAFGVGGLGGAATNGLDSQSFGGGGKGGGSGNHPPAIVGGNAGAVVLLS